MNGRLRVGLVERRRSLVFHKMGCAIILINGRRFRFSHRSISYLIDLQTKLLLASAWTEGTLLDYERKSFDLIFIEDIDKVSEDLRL